MRVIPYVGKRRVIMGVFNRYTIRLWCDKCKKSTKHSYQVTHSWKEKDVYHDMRRYRCNECGSTVEITSSHKQLPVDR